jgi:hypothetical protein
VPTWASHIPITLLLMMTLRAIVIVMLDAAAMITPVF